ncbi:hypothetical protein F4677DRAFT_445930 [Hypoxylon crocopeplum]|nr:hypothetical protein F4677DRAFT_445930 [Hypoxylon crocopeplum]
MEATDGTATITSHPPLPPSPSENVQGQGQNPVAEPPTREAQAEQSQPPGRADGGYRFQCPQCDKRSKSVDNNAQHIKFMHIGTQCYWPGCDVSTADEKGLRMHFTDNHKVEKDDSGYRCGWSGCEKTFKQHPSARKCGRFHQHAAMGDATDSDDDLSDVEVLCAMEGINRPDPEDYPETADATLTEDQKMCI